MGHRLPLIAQLREACPGDWVQDLIAGTVTAILLVPQGMAYALLAGLPPETGLYASIVPPLVYALLGTSRALAVGPVAVAALMVANALGHYAGGDEARWLTGALILAAETGLLLLLLGALRMGALVSFISHPVLSGFTSGAALLIITSQLRHLTGIDLARGDAFDTVHAAVAHIGEIHWPTAAFAATAIVLLLLARGPLVRALSALGVDQQRALTVSRTAPLAVVAMATAAAAALHASGVQGLSIVGAIPAGLPRPDLAFLSAPGWIELAPSAALIALVGYVESVSVAKVLAARRRQKIDANRELVALGAGNLAASVAGAMPVAGGFSRSMVNFDAGARTQLAGIVTAVLVGLVALLFTGWFHYLPQAVLAAIIVVAVARLIDLDGARRIWRYDRADGLALAATFVAVLTLGIEIGLVIGIGLSLALYLWCTSQPHMAVVGRVPGTEHFRNIKRHTVETDPRVLAIRIDENLYFANAGQVEDYIARHLASAPQARYLLLVMAAVNYIDASGLEMLEHLEEDLTHAGVTLHLSEVKGPVQDRLKQTHLYARIADRIHLTTDRAVRSLTQETEPT
ncbi:sulfate transporter [Salinisphaera sp. PC39]|uniref:SulP family inorganic anion transporter n=1 Tax=Salinisphaera sp. PC39 TaxID=1304156 RepID=UPI00333FA9B1